MAASRSASWPRGRKQPEESVGENLETLRLFNQKVDRLKGTGLMSRYSHAAPEVVATLDSMSVESIGAKSFILTGRMHSKLSDLNQDEIDAFVLTFRMFTQKNDRISIDSIARIYEREWMPPDAAARFAEARLRVHQYLASPTSLVVGDNAIAVGDLLGTVIYGGLAHTNRKKEKIFRSWVHDGGITGFIYAEFIAALKEMLRYLTYFSDLNHAVLVNCAS